MPAHTESLVVRGVHFVEDNLHLQGKKSLLRKKRSLGADRVGMGGYLGPRTSLQMGKVWVITKLSATDMVRKNDLQSCLCLLSY